MAEERDPSEDVDELAALAWKRYKDCSAHTADWREKAKASYGFYAGEQWDDTEIQLMEDQGRPAVVFNRIARAVNAVVGLEIGNRQEIRYLPRGTEDQAVADIYSAAVEYVRDGCDAEDEETDAFRDAVICGMGWTDTFVSTEQNLDGEILIHRVDPLEMYWDGQSQRKNLADAKWVMRVRDMSVDEFREMWPDADVDLAGAPWDEASEDDLIARERVYPQDAYERQQGDKARLKDRTIRVAQMQWKDFAQVWRVGASAEEVSDAEYKKLKKKLKGEELPAVKQRKAVCKQAFVAGSLLLESGDSPCREHFTFQCLTGQRNRNDRTWYGLVEAMKDPQKWGNKFFSIIIDILNKNSKGGVMAEREAVDDVRKFEDTWARPDTVAWTRPGAVSKGMISPKPLAAIPQGMDKLMSFALENVNDVTGVSAEMLGVTGRNQPGVLEHQRKQAGVALLSHLFDALRHYRKIEGRVLLYMIATYLADGRLVRIVGPDAQPQFMPIVKSDEVRRYDIVVDDAPTSPNQRERVWAGLMEALPVIGKMGVPLPPELLDYSPLPASLVAKWKETIAKTPKGLPPEVQQQMQKLAQENQQMKQDQSVEMAKLQTAQQTAVAKASLDREKAMAELDLKRQEAAAEIELAQQKAIADIQLRQQQTASELGMQQEKMQADKTAKIEDRKLKMIESGLPEAEGSDDLLSAMAEKIGQAIVPAIANALAEFRTPMRKRVVVNRNPRTGLIETADVIEDFQTQGSA